MKPGSLVRNKPTPPGEYQHQLFDSVFGDWFGMVIDVIPKSRGSKYNRIHILLSSHGGVIGKSWLMDDEISNDIEVLSET